MKYFSVSAARKQTGNLLISTVIALGIIAIAQISAGKYMIEHSRAASGKITGVQLSELKGVMESYITNYGAELQKATPFIAGVANPRSPTVLELQDLGLTNTTGSQAPLLGGAYVTQVTTSPVGCTPPSCNVRARIFLRDPIMHPESGTIDARVLGAAIAGGKGGMGYSLPNTPTIIKSSAGWSEVNPDPSSRPGILMVVTGYDSTGLSQFIKRDGTQPVTADFPMTGLDGVEHSITGAKNIDASGTVTSKFVQLEGVVAENTSCPKNGMLGTNSAGLTLSCQSGVWKYIATESSGTMCGSYFSGSRYSRVAYCKGYNPGSSCPVGFTRRLVMESDDVFFYSCVKN